VITPIFIAYDPGNTTGVAWYSPLDGTFDAYQHSDPINCWFWAQSQLDGIVEELVEDDYIEPHFTVEDYIGGGYRNTDSIATLKRVGYFETRIREYWRADRDRIDLRVVGSNMRKSGLRLAAELLDTTSIPGPHTLDALAHAVVHSRQV